MRRFTRLRIGTKLLSMTLLSLLGMVAIIAIAAGQQRGLIQDERADRTRSVVQVAYGVIDSYGRRAAAGQMSTKDAQAAALAELKKMRYAGNEYFWVNDMHPTMLMHAAKPELDGKDVSGNKDPNGVAIFQEFVKIAQSQQEGFLSYLWPKPGADDPQPKVSYVKAYRPWGWVVGSGVYTDDIAAAAWSSALHLGLVALPLVLLVLLAGWFVARSITRPLHQVTERMRDADLTTRLTVRDDGTELDDLKAALNDVLDRVGTVVEGVASTAGGLDGAARSLAEASAGMDATARETSAQAGTVVTATDEVRAGVDTVAAGTEEMSASIAQIADNAQAAARVAASAVGMARETNATVARLGESSARIGEVVKAITGIAEQTNLLALNATIEAARAGEAGKGFAVVAGEVKELAQESAGATEDIETRVRAMQADVEGAVRAIEGIASIIDEINDYQSAIAGAVEEQTATTQEMSRSVQSAAAGGHEVASGAGALARSAQETAAQVESVQAATHRLQAMSDDLQRAVGSFRH